MVLAIIKCGHRLRAFQQLDPRLFAVGEKLDARRQKVRLIHGPYPYEPEPSSEVDIDASDCSFGCWAKTRSVGFYRFHLTYLSPEPRPTPNAPSSLDHRIQYEHSSRLPLASRAMATMYEERRQFGLVPNLITGAAASRGRYWGGHVHITAPTCQGTNSASPRP